MKKTLNRRELAEECCVSLTTVDSWLRRGCPYIKKGGPGKEWKFNLEAIETWLENRRYSVYPKNSLNSSGKMESGPPAAPYLNIYAYHFALWLINKLQKSEKEMTDLFCQWLEKGKQEFAHRVERQANERMGHR